MVQLGQARGVCTRPSSLGVWLIIAVASLARLLAWLSSLPVTLEGDAHSYLPGKGLAIIESPYVGLEKVSLVGDALRPWPISLLFGVLPTMTSRSFALLAISLIAFAAFAFQAQKFFKMPAIRTLALVSIMAISLSPQVGAWDLEMGGESLTISLLFAVAALVLALVRRPSLQTAVSLIFCSTALMVMRPISVPMLMVVGLVTTWIVFHHFPSRPIKRVLTSASVAILFAVAGVYSLFTVANQELAWQREYGQTYSEAQIGYILSPFNSQQEQLLGEFATKLPSCAIDALPVGIEPISKPWYFASDLQDTCPELTQYVRDGSWRSDYLSFLVTHPDYLFSQAKDAFTINLSPGLFGDYKSPVPQWLTTNFFGNYWDGRVIFEPLLLWIAACLALFVWITLRGRSEGYSRAIIAGTLGIITGLFVWLLASHLVAPTHLIDRWRISIAPAVGVRAFGAVLALALLDRFAFIVHQNRQPL